MCLELCLRGELDGRCNSRMIRRRGVGEQLRRSSGNWSKQRVQLSSVRDAGAASDVMSSS